MSVMFVVLLLALANVCSALTITTGTMIQLKTLSRSVRSDPVQGTNSKLMIDVAQPWLKGSTFVVTITADNKWQLKNLNGKFVTADQGGGAGIYANKDSASGWESFSVNWVNSNQVNLQTLNGQWVGASANSQYAALVATATTPQAWETFDVTIVPRLRGVNLGSWFIPEGWMTDFYSGSSGTDLCSYVSSVGRDNANTKMIQHLQSWITKDDFAWLASQGVNSVRIPLGYWNIIQDPYNKFAPINPSDSLKFVDQAFDWAAAYGMSVLLDLHGGPGSQNGADHSGCSGATGWNSDYNINLSVQTITALAARYSNRSNLYGFELLNEPAYSLEQNHSSLRNYYQSAYNEIRKYSSNAVVVFNVLYGDFYGTWDSELAEGNGGYYSVVTDYHLYDCFGDQNLSTQQHINDANSWGPVIAQHNAYHPIFTGEWSMATGNNPGGQSYADAQENSYMNGIGWYFWNYKMDQDKTNTEWSFRSGVTKYKL